MTNTRPNPQPDRWSVVGAFAQTLSDIRQAAGQPSYRQMAQTSGCISHATLHEATRGKRLPTWETTEQFLIACSADPAAWRHEWDRADRLVRHVNAKPVGPAGIQSEPETSVPEAHSAQRTTAPMPVGVRMRHVAQRSNSPKALLAAALAAVLLFATGYALALWTRPDARAATPAATPNTASPMQAEVDVAKVVAPDAASQSQERTVGSVRCAKFGQAADRAFSSAAGDGLTYQDAKPRRLCSTVAAKSNVRVSFSVKNSGSRDMTGWKLHLVRSTGNCLQDGDRVVPIVGTVKPGGTHTLTLTFTAPDKPGECSAEYEPRDASRKRVFAEGSNVPFAVVVE